MSGKSVFLAAVVASSMLSSAANAQSLLGSTVEFGVYYPTSTSPISSQVSAKVGVGVEFTQIGNLNLPGWIVANADVDISANRIDFDYAFNGTTSNGAFNGYVFNFSNLGGQTITGVSLASETNLPLDNISLSFDADSVLLSLPATAISSSSVLAVDVQLAPVPEPATTYLLLAGGLLVASTMRVRGRKMGAENKL